MEAPDQRSAVNAVVRILRKATRILQLAPFAYLVFFALYMLCCSFVSEEAVGLADSLLSVSPATTAGLLVGSRLFKLCRWHKIACLFPVTGQVETYIDSYIITFTQNEIILINVAIGILALAFFIMAVRHFWYGSKR